jgi:drug/metabolite transporter (DMT)-like permease
MTPLPVADDIGLGLRYMLASTLAMAAMNAAIKWCAPSYPTVEIAFFRQLFALIPVGILIALKGGPRLLKTTRPFGHLIRSVMGNGSLACLVAAYATLPLTDVTAYNFAAPLFLTVISVPLLKEKVGPHRWGAVVAGFIGVLIMMRPGLAINPGIAWALASAVLAAFAQVTIRHLSRTEHALTIVFYFTFFGALFTGLAASFDFVMPATPSAWLPLVVIGLCGGVAQYLMTMSYHHASPARVAPYNYVTLVWAMALQYLIWATVPDSETLAGAALIAASGLYIMYRERVRRRPLTILTTPQQAAD